MGGRGSAEVVPLIWLLADGGAFPCSYKRAKDRCWGPRPSGHQRALVDQHLLSNL